MSIITDYWGNVVPALEIESNISNMSSLSSSVTDFESDSNLYFYHIGLPFDLLSSGKWLDWGFTGYLQTILRSPFEEMKVYLFARK